MKSEFTWPFPSARNVQSDPQVISYLWLNAESDRQMKRSDDKATGLDQGRKRLRGDFRRSEKGLIADMTPFAEMSASEILEILQHATIRRLEPTETYFHEGDRADNFFMLIKGLVRIVRTTEDGEQVTVLHIAPGQLFGMKRAFDNDAYQSTAKAISHSAALSWPSKFWDQFIDDYPGFASATRRAVGTRISELQEKIVEIATQRVEQRVALAIQRLTKLCGKETEQGVEIAFPVTRQGISEMTGTTLHSVSWYMSSWQKDGIIQSSRKRVVVCRLNDLPI